MAERAEFEKVLVRLGYVPAWDGYGYLYEEVQVAWQAWQAARTQPEQPSAGVVPDMTSAIVNDCCWTFVEAMPHNLPGPIFNDLKPALYEALKQYHGSMLTAAPAAQAVQGGGGSEPVAWAVMSAGEILSVEDDEDEAVDSAKLWGASAFPLYPHPHNGEQVGEWVRCDERLPTEADADWDDDVIVFDSEGDMAVTHYGVVEQCGQPGGSITHWKPTGLTRPQPPKSKEGE